MRYRFVADQAGPEGRGDRLLVMQSTRWALRSTKLMLRNDQRAVTALEYGIIASILGLVLVTIFKTLGTTLTTLFSHVGTSI
jgi:Flp pilus assembly pilin Flp